MVAETDKILLIGAHSLIGEDLYRILKPDFNIEAHSRKDLDLTDLDALDAYVQNSRFNAVIYAAGLTDPEACENEKEKTFFLNTEIPSRICRMLHRIHSQARFFYFSDVMIFDGHAELPYNESAKPNPLSIYGKSRAKAEDDIREFHANHIIIRTSWLYGKKTKGIFKKLLQIYQEKKHLSVVGNFRGNPTDMINVAAAMKFLLESDFTGTINISDTGCCSWFDYTALIIKNFMGSTSLKNIESSVSDGSHLKSVRPQNSCLDTSLAVSLGINLPDWKVSLKDFLNRNFPEGIQDK